MDRKIIEDFDKKQRSRKHHKDKKSTHSSGSTKKKTKVEEPELAEPSTSYRDRAKERREGLNIDFELDPDDLRISNPTYDGTQIDGIDQKIDENERRRQEIEESKYLGGDVEHTHLVKGLDFALLEKVKNEQRMVEKLNADKESKFDTLFGDVDSDSEEEEFRNEALLAAGSDHNMADLEKLKKGSTEVIQCRTALARRILNVLDEQHPNRSELFLPGRMSYTVSLDDDDEDMASVTTILRSKEDTLKQDEDTLQSDGDFAFDQLVNILAKVRRGETKSLDVKRPSRAWDDDDAMDDYGY